MSTNASAHPSFADVVVAERRALRTRNTSWARLLARQLATLGVRPNAVSIASAVFAAGAGVCLAISPAAQSNPRAVLLFAAGGDTPHVTQRLATRTGVLYNEIPDRIADVLVLAGAGYATASEPWGAALGWTAAALALFTAYIRVFGGSLGMTQSFAGPMAKQHRMFVLTMAAIASAMEAWLWLPMRAMLLGLVIVVLGSIVTAARRVHRIARELEAR